LGCRLSTRRSAPSTLSGDAPASVATVPVRILVAAAFAPVVGPPVHDPPSHSAPKRATGRRQGPTRRPYGSAIGFRHARGGEAVVAAASRTGGGGGGGGQRRAQRGTNGAHARATTSMSSSSTYDRSTQLCDLGSGVPLMIILVGGITNNTRQPQQPRQRPREREREDSVSVRMCTVRAHQGAAAATEPGALRSGLAPDKRRLQACLLCGIHDTHRDRARSRQLHIEVKRFVLGK
jgi:hypothetical protein